MAGHLLIKVAKNIGKNSFDPAQVTEDNKDNIKGISNLRFWVESSLKESFGGTLPEDGAVVNASLGEWLDISGNTTSIAGNGKYTLNAIDDGINSVFIEDDGESFLANMNHLSNEKFTFFVVEKIQDFTDLENDFLMIAVCTSSCSTTYPFDIVYDNNTGKDISFSSNGVSISFQDSNYELGDVRIFTFVWRSDNKLVIRLNGKEVAVSGTNLTDLGEDSNQIHFARSLSPGHAAKYIPEAIFYSESLSESELKEVEKYLDSKYNGSSNEFEQYL